MFYFHQVEPLEKEAMVVKDMYELIDVFQVPAPLEDFAVYQVTAPYLPHSMTHNLVFSACVVF